MYFIGLDPGIKNVAMVSLSGNYIYTPVYNKDESFYSFVRGFVTEIYELAYEQIRGKASDMTQGVCVCIERQFDKSKEKRLEQFVTIMRYEFSESGIVDILLFAPTQLKLYLTGNGRADESEFWTKYQSAKDKGEIHGDVFNAIDKPTIGQHVLEAQLMGMMGYAKYQYDNGANHYPKYVQNLLDKLVIS